MIWYILEKKNPVWLSIQLSYTATVRRMRGTAHVDRAVSHLYEHYIMICWQYGWKWCGTSPIRVVDATLDPVRGVCGSALYHLAWILIRTYSVVVGALNQLPLANRFWTRLSFPRAKRDDANAGSCIGVVSPKPEQFTEIL